KRGSYHRLSITLGIPCDSDARLKVVLVCLDSFLQPKQVVSGRSQSLRGLELGRNLDVVADAIVESQVVAGGPAVLPEHTDRNVVEDIARVAETLDVVLWHTESVGLYSIELRNRNTRVGRQKRLNGGIDCGRQCIGGRQGPEIVDAAVVHRKRRLHWQVVEVSSELRAVPADGPGKVVGELVSPLRAPDIRIGLAAEIGKARNIHGRVRSPRNRRVIEVRQSALCVLEAKLVHLAVAERPGVLHHSGPVTICLL